MKTTSDPFSSLRSVVRGQPFGDDRWARRTAKRFGLESSFRPQGRPRKDKEPKAT